MHEKEAVLITLSVRKAVVTFAFIFTADRSLVLRVKAGEPPREQ